MPQTHVEYWQKKFERNIMRDRRVREELSQLGWKVVVVWECEVHDGTFSKTLEQALARNDKAKRRKAVSS